MSRPLVTLIVCGAPLTARAADVVTALTDSGYQVSVIGTPASADWLDADAVTRAAGDPPRLSFRAPNEGRRSDVPAAVVVCPATFNTVSKAAVGAADTYALAVLCEALGMRTPIVAVPMVNNRLWGHPAWAGALEVFRSAGAVFLDVRNGERRATAVESGTGPEIVARFDPGWVSAQVKAVLAG